MLFRRGWNHNETLSIRFKDLTMSGSEQMNIHKILSRVNNTEDVNTRLTLYLDWGSELLKY